jgi:hypothetical protein
MLRIMEAFIYCILKKNCTCIYSVTIVHTSLGYYQINIRKLFHVVSLVGNWNRILYLPGTGNISFHAFNFSSFVTRLP